MLIEQIVVLMYLELIYKFWIKIQICAVDISDSHFKMLCNIYEIYNCTIICYIQIVSVCWPF